MSTARLRTKGRWVRAARWGAAAAVLVAVPANGQDHTHPRDMDLPMPTDHRPDPLAMQLRLDNGLTAYVAEDHRAPLVVFTAFVAVGSADGAAGEADLVAAALRGGPGSLAPGQFRAALDAMAAVYTVTMTHEETEVTLDVPAEDAWRALDLFAETLRSPAFGRVAARTNLRTAQAEGIDWASSIQGAIDAFHSHLFRGHRYGRTVTSAEIDRAEAGGASSFHSRHFVPSNTVLAVSGSFDASDLRSRLTTAFAVWPAADRPELPRYPTVETSAPRKVLQAQADKLQGWVVMGHEIPPVPEEDRAPLAVMDYILGAYHLDTRLFRASRSQRGLTNDNSSFLEPSHRGPGTYTMRTYGRPEVVQLLVDITFRELERIRAEPVTEEELFVARGALADGTHPKRYWTGLDAARTYAREWLHSGSHDWSDRWADRIRSVTVEQVQAMARKYLHPDRMVIAVVGPLERITSAPSLEGEPPLASWGEVVRIDAGGPP